MSDLELKELNNFGKFVENNNVSNEVLVQFIELAGSYLNLKTIPDYAKQYGITYNGVKKARTIRNIFNVKFVIDNN